MLSKFLARALAERGIHYAWVIAAVTFLAMLTTASALGLPGAMLPPLTKEFGWTTEQLSSVFAVRFVLFGLQSLASVFRALKPFFGGRDDANKDGLKIASINAV